jgi:mycothiol system anti-sigma-R factor
MKGEREVGGLRCSEVLAGLSDYLDGELSPDTLARVELHLAGCDNCARFGGEMGAMVAAVRAQLQDAAPSEVRDRLRERLRREREES